MSLEQALAENTAAIKSLTAAWLALTANAEKAKAGLAAGEGVDAGGVPIVPGKSTTKTTTAPAKDKPAAAPSAPAAPAAAAASSGEDANAPSYEQVAKAINAFVASAGKPAAIAKLAELGVKTGKELKPEQYAEALAKFSAADGDLS